MTRVSLVTIWTTAFLAVIWGGGCTWESKTVEKITPNTGSAHKDDHKGHDHAKHGPHGGHIVEIGEEEYHAEWTHDDDSGSVTVYILDKYMVKEVPIEAGEIEIETVVADSTKSYTLVAVNASSGDKPTASQFSIEDKTLSVALHAAGSEGTAATLKVTIQNKPFAAKFEKHEH